ncbi:MAG TPA: SAM-dependent chlorinase/fluorinase [Acidimicrobiales bacterium]|nr:SAM-dependent chlorinase/fluorinase [Acidimicrobiales bacterium]
MAAGFETVSFLSDYGLEDEFVGVVKAVIRGIAPAAAVIDITHQVPPHDVRAGGLTLARTMQYLPPGVVLAVVDPGVATERKAVAVEVGGAPGADGEEESRSVLVGPDNGLLAPAVALAGGARRAVALTNDEFHLPAPGPTFAGRDVFAPVAAHLCNGVELDELGEPVDPNLLVPGILPLSRTEGGGIESEVLWVDRFGNAQLNVDPSDIDDLGSPVVLRIGERSRTAVRASAFAELGPGQIGLIVDSYGLIAVALDRRSAADELHLGPGDAVRIEPAGD